MRGRVNTDLYSGISLNANTDQFEVSGGNVVAGDFVQYKYAGAERKQLSANRLSASVKYYKVTNDLYITNEGVLYDVSSGNMIQVAAAEYTGKFIDHISDYKYLLGCVDITLAIEVDVINKTITTLSSVEHPGYNSIIALGVVGANRNRAIRWSNSTSSYNSSKGTTVYTNWFSILDISDLNNISIIQNYHQSSASSSAGNDTMEVAVSIYLGTSENKFFFYSNAVGYNGARILWYEYIEFDETTDYFVLDSSGKPVYTRWSAPSDESSTYYGLHPNNIYDNRYCVTIKNGTVANMRLYVHDLNSKTTKSMDLFQSDLVVRTDHYTTSNTSRGIYTSEIDENGDFYIASTPFNSNVGNGIGLCKCHIGLNGQIEVIGNLISFKPSDTAPYSIITPLNLGNKSIMVLMPTTSGTTEGSGTYYYNAEVVNGDIVIGEQTDKVEPYDGTNPKMLLGVAAQSGSSGDTIDVYVPLANT